MMGPEKGYLGYGIVADSGRACNGACRPSVGGRMLLVCSLATACWFCIYDITNTNPNAGMQKLYTSGVNGRQSKYFAAIFDHILK
jgi:hypothetical protein